MASFTGAAFTTPETNYKKYDFDDIEYKNPNTNKTEIDDQFKIQGGWAALVQHYFVSAWVPSKDTLNSFEVYKSKKTNLNVLQFNTPSFTVLPKSGGSIGAAFYVGPKNIKEMQKLAPHLDKTLDFGWLWFIAKPLFSFMDKIHSFVGNWGIAIILITLAIKVVFFYPSAMSYRSMAKMRKLMPQIQELKDRYGDDRQCLGTETMKLYKKAGANPFGGCLPILLQMPVFIALYWMIMESVELRHSPFYFWIQDLSVKDPLFVLPLLMGATMYVQQKLNPPPPDPMQAKIMQMLPIFFTFLFLFFPSGLVLYWVVNNSLSITQQYIINRQIQTAE